MAELKFQCRNCQKPYAVPGENAERYAGRIIDCPQCHNPLKIPRRKPKRPPPEDSVEELPVARISFSERLAERFDAACEFATATNPRKWATIGICIVVALILYKEFSLWRTTAHAQARRREMREEQQAQLERQRQEAERQRLLNEPRVRRAPRAGHRKPAEPDPKTETGDPQPAEVPVEKPPLIPTPDESQETSQLPAKTYRVTEQTKPLTFTNGQALLLPRRQNLGVSRLRGAAHGSQSSPGIGLVVQQGGPGGLISCYSHSGGTHVKTLATRLGGSHPLLLSADGRYVAATTFQSFRKRKLTLIDTSNNAELLNQAGTPLCFSADGRQLALLTPDGELRVWKMADGGNPLTDDGRGGLPKVKLGFITAATFLRPNLLLVGTHKGELAIVEMPFGKVHQRIRIGRPVEQIHAVGGDNKFVVQFAWAEDDVVAAGQAMLMWFDYDLQENHTRNAEIAAPVYSCRLTQTGTKQGGRPVFSKNSGRMALIEPMPVGRRNAVRKRLCIYDMRQPNQLLQVMEVPQRLVALRAFGDNGQYLFADAGEEQTLVIDAPERKAYVLGETEPLPNGFIDTRGEATILPLGETQIASVSRFGKVTLYRLGEALPHAVELNKSTGIPKRVFRQIGTRTWTVFNRRVAARVTGCENGRVRLTAEGESREIPLKALHPTDQQYLGWTVGGPTAERYWSLAKGSTANLRAERILAHITQTDTIKAKLVRMEHPYLYLEQEGQVVRVAKALMARKTLDKISAMGRRRFLKLLPRVESLREYAWDALPSSFDGRWEIVSGTYMRGYSIAKNYPRAEDRTVTIQGNRMRIPVFAIPAAPSVTSWTDYRVVYDRRTKLLYRLVDGVNGDAYVEYPFQIQKRGRQIRMVSTTSQLRAQPWKLKKIGDDPAKQAAAEVRRVSANDSQSKSQPNTETLVPDRESQP